MSPNELNDWQSNLIGLLSRLEHLRGELAGRRLTDPAAQVLDITGWMVQAAEDLAVRTQFADTSAALYADAVARAGLFFTAAAALKRPQQRGLAGWLVGVFGDEKAVSGRAVRECLAVAVEALHGYFTLFTDRFPSSAAARGWVDAASSYLADFKQQVRNLPEY